MGKWTEVPKGLHTLQPGVALYQFDCPIIFKVFGEMSLYCNVKDVGLVSITGCCHQGIILFADTAYKELAYEMGNAVGEENYWLAAVHGMRPLSTCIGLRSLAVTTSTILKTPSSPAKLLLP